MRTMVITGGTHGIGKALALHYLTRGDRVIAVGSSPARGEALLAEAGERGLFLPVDLSSAADTVRLGGELRARYPRIDALVLGAFRYETTSRETAEGLERTFALYVMSRFLLAEALRPALEQAPRPVVVNLCGTGGRAGRLHWDDLQLRARYRATAAVMQGARANDLLGVAFTEAHPATPVRYVLHNPVFVDTGLAEPFRQPKRAVVNVAAKLFATPVDRAVEPIIARIDTPPEAALSAFRGRRTVDVTGPAFDPAAARRLTRLLREMALPVAKA
jgi:NAD(P)-dependent dehydrogenase (short-subunit alcohol dehydrogenase family)